MTGAPPPPPPPGVPPGGRQGFDPPPPPPGYAPGVPPGYQQAPPGMAQPHPGTNGMAIASLVLGIISLPMCFLFLPALLAVIFGIIGLNQLKSRPGQAGRGQAIAGLILGSISLAFVVIAVIAVGSATWNLEAVMVTVVG